MANYVARTVTPLPKQPNEVRSQISVEDQMYIQTQPKKQTDLRRVVDQTDASIPRQLKKPSETKTYQTNYKASNVKQDQSRSYTGEFGNVVKHHTSWGTVYLLYPTFVVFFTSGETCIFTHTAEYLYKAYYKRRSLIYN